jgi:hypothetical protein
MRQTLPGISPLPHNSQIASPMKYNLSELIEEDPENSEIWWH